MINPFKRAKQTAVDIGNFSVKAVSQEKIIWQREPVFACAVEYLPIQPGPEQVAEAVKKVVKKVGTVSGRVNILACGQDVIYRYIQLPLMRKKDLIEVIRLEWDKYLPMQQDEIVWDLEILGVIEDPLKGKQLLVLLVVVKKDFISQREDLLKKSGLGLDAVDSGVTSLVNAFNFFNPGQPKDSLIALLDIGDSAASLVILKNRIPRFSREILFGGRDITYLLVQKKRIDFLRAQELKHSFDGQNQDIGALIKSGITNLTNEIRMSFDYLKRETEQDISMLYLSGGGVRLSGIKELLEQDLGVKATHWQLGGSLKDTPEAIQVIGAALY
jgi:type IV pilus assembly protein PilM